MLLFPSSYNQNLEKQLFWCVFYPAFYNSSYKMSVLCKRERSDSHKRLNSSPETGINDTAGQAAPEKGSLCSGYLQSDPKHAARSALAQEGRTVGGTFSKLSLGWGLRTKHSKAMGRDPEDLDQLWGAEFWRSLKSVMNQKHFKASPSQLLL